MSIPNVEVATMALADLTPAPYNPRTIDDAALAGLRASIERFGLVEPIVWNKRTRHVVGGHQRLKVLAATGATESAVMVVDLPAHEEAALNVALNNPHIAGEFTDDLQDLLAEIEAEDAALFEALRLDELDDATGGDSGDEVDGAAAGGGWGEPAWQYLLVFEDEPQQLIFYDFIKGLRRQSEGESTVAGRIVAFLLEHEEAWRE